MTNPRTESPRTGPPHPGSDRRGRAALFLAGILGLALVVIRLGTRAWPEGPEASLKTPPYELSDASSGAGGKKRAADIPDAAPRLSPESPLQDAARRALTAALPDPEAEAALHVLVVAVKGWANADPTAALTWAEALHPDTGPLRAVVLAAALEGACAQPELALRLGLALLAREPADLDRLGGALVGGLVRANAFTLAMQAAESADDDERKVAWLALVLDAWVRQKPEDAPDIVSAMQRQGLHGASLRSMFDGWALAAPESLAAHALAMPPGEDRRHALAKGIEAWALQDPMAVGAWLAKITDPDEYQRALGVLIANTDQVHRPTATALAWAESLADVELRMAAMTRVVKEWAARDPAAARDYIDTAPGLDAAQREALAAALRPAPPDS